MTHEILISGFGGQGVLFAGKLLAYAAMLEEKYVSWLPSYGPEMRGGTANCSVIISDEPVSCPLVTNPTVLVAMNAPSLDKFEDSVTKDGKIFTDASLISQEFKRNDTSNFAIPSTKMAEELQASKLSNMVLLGKVVKETSVLPFESIINALKKTVPASKQAMLEINKKALETGFNA
ncbi:MAG: 2-oxoacid:acceptor oxidoreductase family protein [Clostridia bacterium]|nr:2-oxoacid:acceptor oxidoreductase family protein [Clostridia bacterium]